MVSIYVLLFRAYLFVSHRRPVAAFWDRRSAEAADATNTRKEKETSRSHAHAPPHCDRTCQPFVLLLPVCIPSAFVCVVVVFLLRRQVAAAGNCDHRPETTYAHTLTVPHSQRTHESTHKEQTTTQFSPSHPIRYPLPVPLTASVTSPHLTTLLSSPLLTLPLDFEPV